MDYFLLFGIVGFSLLIICFVAYKLTTDKIIKDQDRENAQLKTENRRLQAALRGAQYTRIIEISDRRTNGTAQIDFPNSRKDR